MDRIVSLHDAFMTGLGLAEAGTYTGTGINGELNVSITTDEAGAATSIDISKSS